jgi:hypothetical protein
MPSSFLSLTDGLTDISLMNKGHIYVLFPHLCLFCFTESEQIKQMTHIIILFEWIVD